MPHHIPRFYLAEENATVVKGSVIKISPKQMHHAVNVLRLKVGNVVKIFNEKIGEWRCVIRNVERGILESVIQDVRPAIENKLEILVAFSLINPARMLILLEKITELGVSEIIPIVSQYVQRPHFNKEKAKQVIIGACEQSGRISVPKLHEVEKLKGFLDDYSYGSTLIIGDEKMQGGKSVLDIPNANKFAFLIGPEGGFSDDERKLFEKYPFIERISLGENILRSETAAIALTFAAVIHKK